MIHGRLPVGRCLSTTLLSAALLTLPSCRGLGEGPLDVDVVNDSPKRVRILANEDGGDVGPDAWLKPGKQATLSWADCGTGWIILSVQRDAGMKEVRRVEVEMCPGDTLTVGRDFQMHIDCGDTSRRERDDEC